LPVVKTKSRLRKEKSFLQPVQSLQSYLGHYRTGYLELPAITPDWMNTVIRIVATSANSKSIRYSEVHRTCVTQEEMKLSSAKSTPTSSVSTLGALRQNLSELRIVFVFLGMVNMDMPLQIIWSRILVFSFRTEWADITGRLMY